MDKPDNKPLSPDHAAAVLGCSNRTLRRKAQAGEIKRVTINGRVYYKIPDRPEMTTPTGQPDEMTNRALVLQTAFQERGELVKHLQKQQARLRRSNAAGWVVAVAALVGVALLFGQYQARGVQVKTQQETAQQLRADLQIEKVRNTEVFREALKLIRVQQEPAAIVPDPNTPETARADDDMVTI